MKRAARFAKATLIPFLVCGLLAVAQEEESAELYMEEYTDKYQEVFFRALQEKGVENYDRAAALLLECKQLDPLDPVLDHELARVLTLQEEYAAAESYAVAAVRASPEEFWYARTLLETLEPQYKQPEDIADLLPMDIPEFRMNLARCYLERSQGDRALALLEGMAPTAEVKLMRFRAEQFSDGPETDAGPGVSPVEEPSADGTVPFYREQIEGLLAGERWEEVLELGSEAIESYPLQPFFYFARGQALLSLGRASEAAGTLETGAEYLLENGPLAVRIYTALAEAYTTLGEEEKAAEYRLKIKNGL